MLHHVALVCISQVPLQKGVFVVVVFFIVFLMFLDYFILCFFRFNPFVSILCIPFCTNYILYIYVYSGIQHMRLYNPGSPWNLFKPVLRPGVPQTCCVCVWQGGVARREGFAFLCSLYQSFLPCTGQRLVGSNHCCETC